MYVKEITYTDFDGNERTEKLYFNLTKTELAKMELSKDGGLSKYIQRIYQEKDAQKLWDIFEEIVVMSYGEKSPDGRRFIKSKEIKDNFIETNAFSDFMMELLSDADKASEFVNGLVSEAKREDVSSIPAPTLVKN